jgi:hypothetical protein
MKFLRPAVATLSIACLAFVLALASTGIALAQAKQLALTDKQIEGVLAAKQDFDAIDDKPSNAPADQKGLAQLDAVAKKNGFANYAEHETVVDNIKLVLAGFDPATKKYVGAEAVSKARIARVQADKTMSANDKKAALAEIREELKSLPSAVPIKANIDLVAKYYDQLAKALADDND